MLTIMIDTSVLLGVQAQQLRNSNLSLPVESRVGSASTTPPASCPHYKPAISVLDLEWGDGGILAGLLYDHHQYKSTKDTEAQSNAYSTLKVRSTPCASYKPIDSS